MTELWQKPATELAAAIRGKTLSSRELVSATLDRIERLNGETNAFALVDAEGALKAADAADAAVARGGDLGALHGLPVTVKDLVPTAGMRTALASHIFADNVPAQDAEAVARIRKAGGIILGKTTTPELGHKVLTDSPMHGITRNPWALDRPAAVPAAVRRSVWRWGLGRWRSVPTALAPVAFPPPAAALSG
jgi:aspartyl-tRNA(Asn)/glutamyl-tRNA(Gln) amidotransferase subunit A